LLVAERVVVVDFHGTAPCWAFCILVVGYETLFNDMRLKHAFITWPGYNAAATRTVRHVYVTPVTRSDVRAAAAPPSRKSPLIVNAAFNLPTANAARWYRRIRW
jgi:hypothetical protein